jgi:PAS domain-containing protein
MRSTKSKPLVLLLLMIICSIFYYFGELADWAAWESLRNSFFYGIHDIHRLLFLAPIIYAGYNARIRGALIITLISFIIFLPRAFFISPYPDPLLRMILFTVFAGVIGVLVGCIRNHEIKYRQLETVRMTELERMKGIINGLADGIVITDGAYRIRYMNSSMVDNYGEGTGLTCYQHLRKADAPCQQNCKIADVIGSGKVEQWQCVFPDGKVYDVTAAPYTDSDGTECQVSIFRDRGVR